MMGSCNVSKYLNENEYLVKKNKIVLENPALSKQDPELIYNLESLILQKPNRKFAFIPREWLYYRYLDKYNSDSKKKGLVAEAEPPVIFQDLQMWYTAERMEKYLRF